VVDVYRYQMSRSVNPDATALVLARALRFPNLRARRRKGVTELVVATYGKPTRETETFRIFPQCRILTT
jgi:hypothetical protein